MRRVYRARGLRLGLGIVSVWFFLSSSSTVARSEASSPVVTVLLIGLLALLFLGIIGYRAGWAHVRAEQAGLRVRNIFRTVWVPWAEVAAFEVGNFGVLRKVGVRCRDGRIVPIAGLPVSGGKPGGSVAKAMTELEDLLASMREGSCNGTPP